MLPTGWCDPKAKPIYVESIGRRKRPGTGDRILTLYMSGRWSERKRGVKMRPRVGCIHPSAFRQVEARLRSANFRPMPRPRVQCAAVPSTFTTYRDVARRRVARASHPCGVAVRPSLVRMSRVLRNVMKTRAVPLPGPRHPAPPILVAPPPPAPPVAVGRCKPVGQPIYSHTIVPITRRSRRAAKPKPAPPREALKIYRNGAWTMGGLIAGRQGCMYSPELRQFRRQLQVTTRGRDRTHRFVCKALNRQQIVFRVRGAIYYRWPRPCGIRPNPSLLNLYKLARKITKT